MTQMQALRQLVNISCHVCSVATIGRYGGAAQAAQINSHDSERLG